MKKSLILALAAGAAASAAFAQVDQPRSKLQPAFIDGNGQMQLGQLPQSRASQPVYDADSAAVTTLIFSRYQGWSHIGDDITYGGPWAVAPSPAPNNVITDFNFSFARNGAVRPAGADVFMRCWEDVDYTASPMVTAASNNFFTLYAGNLGLQVNGQPNGLGFFWTFPGVTFAVPEGDNSIFVEMEMREPGSATAPGAFLPGPFANGTTFAINQPYLFWGVGEGAPSVGTTLPDWACDVDTDGIFEGGPLVTYPDTNSSRAFGSAEHRATLFNGNPTRLWFQWQGEIPPPPAPTADVDLTLAGCLPDGQTVANGIVTAGSADPRDDAFWVKFCLNNDVLDANLAYLDIDNEGSALFNTAMVLYNAEGGFIVSTQSDAGIDFADGSGDLAQLSFGAGNRAANGDGVTFNGIDGELTTLDGPFWVGTAAEPLVSPPGEGWSLLSDPSSAGAPVTVRIRTNVNDPITNTYTPVPPTSIELTPPGGAPGDPVFGVIDNGNVQVNDPGVVWYTFVTCKELELNDPDANDYLDIDFFQSGTASDMEAFLFDSNGNLVASSDDEGDGFLPQFSFGNSSNPRVAGAAPYGVGEVSTYSGQNGALPQGRYYLGFAFFDAQTLPGNDRWFIRPQTPNDNVGVGADLISGNASGDCSLGCDSIDFNGDGLFPDNQDIQDFFDVFGGGACSTGTCNDIDFNNDQLFPDNADLEAFLRVFGGGACAG